MVAQLQHQVTQIEDMSNESVINVNNEDSIFPQQPPHVSFAINEKSRNEEQNEEHFAEASENLAHDCDSDAFVMQAEFDLPDDSMLVNDDNEMFSNDESKFSSWKDKTDRSKCTINAGKEEAYDRLKFEENHVKECV